MKKINFSDAYGLTEAVLSGRKTQTRRLIPIDLYNACDWREAIPMFEDSNGDWHPFYESKYVYKVGEVVAVAQSYADAGLGNTAPIIGADENDMPIFASEAGVYNKMFVRADLMPHQIRITNVRVERLNDISEADCLAEGIEKVKECEDLYRIPIFHKSGRITYIHGSSPRAVYAALIDRIAGRGVWSNNPFVFVYDFELIK